MAKKDKKKDKQAAKGVDADALAQLRSVLERTFEGAQHSTREVVDEIAAAAGKLRSTIEDLRVLDEVKRLRREVEALAAKVASLDSEESKPAPAPAKKPAARKTAAKRTAVKRKPAARKAAAKRTATKKPAASRARKPAAKKPAAAAQPKPAATTPKPAA